jgi:hypothetical protein
MDEPRHLAVYLLQHSYDRDGCEDTKLIGIYSSTESARRAEERLRLQPGFTDHIDDFSVATYELDVDHWTEGFVQDSL